MPVVKNRRSSEGPKVTKAAASFLRLRAEIIGTKKGGGNECGEYHPAT